MVYSQDKLMTKIRQNFMKIKKASLQSLKNHELRIVKRQKEIEFLDTLFRPTPLLTNKLLKPSFNNTLYHTRNTFYKTIKSNTMNNNFPKLNTDNNFNSLNTYNRMKKYKVIFRKKKDLLPEEKIKKLLHQSGFTYIPNPMNLDDSKKKNGDKNNNNNKINVKFDKNIIDEDKINTNRTKKDDKKDFKKLKNNKKMDFEYYLKMQSKAEIMLKPKIGDNSNDLVNYINAIQGIRENLIIDILSEINRTENRYNKEKPEVDANFSVKDKRLNVHKWKNIFYLRDYQKYFSEGLKGKISNSNYRQMQRKFFQINQVCFSEGKTHFHAIKNINFSE